jgi:Fe-S-cluster-containing dehydrogenase component
MSKYGMVINLHDCVACGACALACKTENNTQYGQEGRKYNWADFHVETEGTFPNVKQRYFPVLCNHCTDAPCVAACPVNPKAMYKTENGMTMHNDDRCIGCKACISNCPYSDDDVLEANVQYSIITHNPFGENTQAFYANEDVIIEGGTASPKELVDQVGIVPPCKNDYTHSDYSAVRPEGVTEKCIFCDHRVQDGLNPYCVDSCPTNARIFGDMEDSESAISIALSENDAVRMRNNKGEFLSAGEGGTDPNVFYIGDIEGTTSIDEITESRKETINIFPNPAKSYINVDVSDITFGSSAIIMIHDISGKAVKTISNENGKFNNQNLIRVDTSSLKRGTYIVSFRSEEAVHSATIVLN